VKNCTSYSLWIRFKALCCLSKNPKGIDKETLRNGIPQLSLEDHFFIDRVFTMLDTDQNGILEGKEFIEALSCVEKSTFKKGKTTIKSQFQNLITKIPQTKSASFICIFNPKTKVQIIN
jgi:hypothetical protein